MQAQESFVLLNEHGAMVAEKPEVLFNDEPCQVILDTGCRTAVAGEKWHRRFQEELRRCGLGWEEVPHHEIFRLVLEHLWFPGRLPSTR